MPEKQRNTQIRRQLEGRGERKRKKIYYSVQSFKLWALYLKSADNLPFTLELYIFNPLFLYIIPIIESSGVGQVYQ